MSLEGLYVVRTTFKAGGNLYEAGLLLKEEDLHQIKLFKMRLNEQKIIPLPEDQVELKNLCDYFKVRMGIDLKARLRTELLGKEEATKKEAPKIEPQASGVKNQQTATKAMGSDVAEPQKKESATAPTPPPGTPVGRKTSTTKPTTKE